MKIGVFDSGIGGEAVALSLREAFSDAEIITVNDSANVPYGDRSMKEIVALTNAAIKPLLNAECDVIVIACNSATAAAIETLRERYPEQSFIGLEPMIKPAVAQTQSGVIAICATPASLQSPRYLQLKQEYAHGMTVLEPDCSTWARMIEDSDINEVLIRQTIEDLCKQGADVIVLACTHYHWIRRVIESATTPEVTILDPSHAIVKRVATLAKTTQPL